MGELLRDQELTPDLIISSDAVRARLTAAAVAEAAGYAGEIALDPRLYHAGPAEIVAVLRELPAATPQRVLIVGHNPGLETFVTRVTGEHADFPTAALAHIELPLDRWSELADSTHGTLVALWRPKERA